jgi:hypothetical protein
MPDAPSRLRRSPTHRGLQYVSVLVGWGGTPGIEGALGDPAVRMSYRDGGRRLLTFAIGSLSTRFSSWRYSITSS